MLKGGRRCLIAISCDKSFHLRGRNVRKKESERKGGRKKKENTADLNALIVLTLSRLLIVLISGDVIPLDAQYLTGFLNERVLCVFINNRGLEIESKGGWGGYQSRLWSNVCNLALFSRWDVEKRETRVPYNFISRRRGIFNSPRCSIKRYIHEREK